MTWWVFLISLLSGALYIVVYFAQRGMARSGQLWGYTLTYYAATLALFGLYAWLLILCRRGHLQHTPARGLALFAPILFNLGLLFGQPYLSIDSFTNLAHGYLGTAPGGNPYVQRAADVASTDFGARLIAAGWPPIHGITPYGPLWTHYEVMVLRLTEDVSTAVLLLKALVVIASLGSAGLIWGILGRVRPGERVLGTLIYLWNPLVIVEFAAEGHNDALMLLFVLGAVWLSLGRWPALALVMVVLGVLVKFVPLILIPAQIAYQWATKTTQPQRMRLVAQLALGLLISLGLAILLYQPFWVGQATFQGLRWESTPRIAASTAGTLYWALLQSPAQPVAALVVRLLTVSCGVAFLLISRRVQNAEGYLKACGAITLVYVLVASLGYWPWYATLPLVFLALAARGPFLWIALVLSLGARLAAPLDLLGNQGFITSSFFRQGTVIFGVALPLLALLGLSIWSWRGHRSGLRPRESPPLTGSGIT